MNPFDKIIKATEKAILSRVKDNSIFAEYYNRSNGNKASYYKQPTFYNTKEIKDWQMAVQQATDPFYPKRGSLMRFYQ